ncbi:MAG: hydroxyacylglutathione hydrolase [Gammaproteobacteria bacterium]|nr:hydroxyacylglutathione hydrolase [Gammaproteobacteria bacterium]
MTAVLHVPAFEDNYIWLICSDTGNAAIVDPGDAAPVRAVLARLGLTPAAILCTHHHGDHIGGVDELVADTPVPVYGPARENIPGVTHPVSEGDVVSLAPLGLQLQVIDIPGHTAGHIAYHGAGMLFCGDTLFSAGCGRLFEGTAGQMFRSLQRLAALPPDTRVFCAHEYTEANLRFALAVDPDNAEARQYRDAVIALRRHDRPSLPSTIARERSVNPFLRSDQPRVRASVEAFAQRRLASDCEVFAALRRWKDGFKG